MSAAKPACGHPVARQLQGVPDEYRAMCDHCVVSYQADHGILFSRRQDARPTPAGTQRRLQALIARAWSPAAIERAGEVPAAAIRRALADRESISPDLASAVSGAYDRLWDKQPPQRTPAERAAAQAHREHAQRCGWAPPLAWDDDEIDLDDAQPAEGWRRTGRHTILAADLVEDAEWVREHGGYRMAGNTEVAMRLGVHRNRLDKAYERQRAREGMAEREAG